MEPIARLIMVTPFDSSIASLSADEQLVRLRGCVLCQITRDLDNGSTRTKPEWKSCKEEFGCAIDILTIDRIDSAIAEAWRSRGWLSSSTACDSGTRQAPNTPCSRRKATSCVRLCAAPHNIDAMVKPTTDHMNRRLRPSRADK